MMYRVPGLDEESQEKLAKLARRPRSIELVSATDGNTFTFVDDGAGVSDSGITPNGRRAQLIAAANKRLYVDGELIPAYFAAKKIDGIWKGDPLAAIPVYGDKAKKIVEKLKAKRATALAAGAASMIAAEVKKPKPAAESK